MFEVFEPTVCYSSWRKRVYVTTLNKNNLRLYKPVTFSVDILKPNDGYTINYKYLDSSTFSGVCCF